jgi:hypothetical protein
VDGGGDHQSHQPFWKRLGIGRLSFGKGKNKGDKNNRLAARDQRDGANDENHEPVSVSGKIQEIEQRNKQQQQRSVSPASNKVRF